MNTIVGDAEEINLDAREAIIPIVDVIARTEALEEMNGLIEGGSHLGKIDDAVTTVNSIEEEEIALGDTMK